MIIKNDIINNGKDKSNGNTMPVIMIKQDIHLLCSLITSIILAIFR